jgi:hypothetical protein
VNRVRGIAEREVQRDGEQDDGDRVRTRRHGRSERDAGEPADGLEVERTRHDVGAPPAPHSGRGVRPARSASQPSSARRAAPLAKIPCRYVPVTVPVASVAPSSSLTGEPPRATTANGRATPASSRREIPAWIS